MAYEMAVERGKIREFARATRSQNPAYLDDPQPVCPPTFLQTSSFWAPAKEGDGMLAALGGDLARALHGGQEFVFHGEPPRAGTILSVSSRKGDSWEKQGKRGGTLKFTQTITEFRDPEGNLVAESKSTLIITERAPSEG